ncbi:MAG: type II secretion system minor pseudopilin GspK [Burkholderiaceae bacterium]
MVTIKTRKYQQGVAVITALLLTTLAITIVANLFWQQQVQVRSIENQRLQSQKQWILRGSLDWASLIVREDAKKSSVDYIGEPWSIPLAETRLDDFAEDKPIDGEESAAVLSGSISDAQGRYNLANLAVNGVINPLEVNTLRRLLINLKLNPSLAQTIADMMARTQQRTVDSSNLQSPTISANTSVKHQMSIEQSEDLLAVPGLTIEMFQKIRDFVVVLPHPTPLNVNTAAIEVLAASVDALSMQDAKQLVDSRDHAYFKDPSDFGARLPGKTLTANNIATYTNFFLVNGNVRINHASLKTQALIERNIMIGSRIIWIREI